MNIRYNQIAGRFEAEFTTDFQGDLLAVKTAGFKCDGPPAWVWHTSKLPVLNKLRENKPVSGLSINEDAYQAYLRLTELEKANEAARAQFAPIKEKQVKEKKERKKKELRDQTYTELIIPHKPGELYDYIGKEDLPPVPPFVFKNPPQPHQGPFCVICQAPVYFYELQNPPTCLFCEVQIDAAKKT